MKMGSIDTDFMWLFLLLPFCLSNYHSHTKPLITYYTKDCKEVKTRSIVNNDACLNGQHFYDSSRGVFESYGLKVRCQTNNVDSAFHLAIYKNEQNTNTRGGRPTECSVPLANTQGVGNKCNYYIVGEEHYYYKVDCSNVVTNKDSTVMKQSNIFRPLLTEYTNADCQYAAIKTESDNNACYTTANSFDVTSQKMTEGHTNYIICDSHSSDASWSLFMHPKPEVGKHPDCTVPSFQNLTGHGNGCYNFENEGNVRYVSVDCGNSRRWRTGGRS